MELAKIRHKLKHEDANSSLVEAGIGAALPSIRWCEKAQEKALGHEWGHTAFKIPM